MFSFKNNGAILSSETEAYYEERASQEDICLEVIEETVRARVPAIESRVAKWQLNTDPNRASRVVLHDVHAAGRLTRSYTSMPYAVEEESVTQRQSLRPETATGEHDDGLSAFAGVRPRLFGIAYRMLGSAAEAEDIVQDVWVRWQSTNRSVVENPSAFLTTTTTRLCINLAQSAQSRRETYVGTWLPEPVDTSCDPGLGAERGEALSLAVLVLLEKLSATERAAYVLREAFDYPYREIADILKMDQANVRQLVSRGRKHIADGRRAPVTSAEQRRLLEAFLGAAPSLHFGCFVQGHYPATCTRG